MDDVYVFGPAGAVVFPAIERFASALQRLSGLQINQRTSRRVSREATISRVARGGDARACQWVRWR